MALADQVARGRPRFLDAGGRNAALIRAIDWSATPLGAIAGWPASLKAALALLLRSPSAMALQWGPQRVLFYNDACISLLVEHHPLALGSTAANGHGAALGFSDQLVDDVLAGRPRRVDDCGLLVGGEQAARSGSSANFSALFDDDDRAAGVVAVFEHGDRAGVDKAVRLSEARNRQILDGAIDYAIIAFDFAGRVTRWNIGAQRVFGWTEAEMLGRDASRIFTPEDQAAGRMAEEMRAALTAGAGNDERWHVRSTGERFWASGEMTPLRDEDGTVIGFVKVLRDRTEQHLAAQALRRSQERLRRAQEAGGVGTFTLDLVADLIDATPEFFRIFGLDYAPSVPATVFEKLVVAEDSMIRSQALTRNARTAPLDVEYRIHRANDGALRWIARKAEYECDADGRALALVGVVIDVTERKAALAAIEQSAAHFRTFAQSLPNHVWTAPANGQLDWCNDRIYEYCGVARGQLDGSAWAQIVHPDDVGLAGQRWQHALDGGESYEIEFRLRAVDGSYRWHLARALPVLAADGTISRWIGTNTDIHERKLAATRSERDFDRIWTLSQELMLVCDLDGLITAVNPAARRLLDWNADEMVGRKVFDFLHPEDVAVTVAEGEKLSTGVSTLAFENRYRRRDGSYRRLNWTAVPDGTLIHAVARDVTNERATEDALRQAQKMEAVGQLTGGVAHDFNNLLTIIRTSIDLLRRPELADDRRPRFMEAISNAVTRAARLTGQLLAFARRQALQPVTFDAAQNVHSVAEMIATLVGSRIGVDVRTDDRPCIVHADPSQFDTAIVNIAVNARDAMSGSGKLTLAVAHVTDVEPLGNQRALRGDYIAVSLSDSGCGIAPELLDKIFEPFFTTKEVGLGTGLGLSQVFGFAKQSGGEVRVASVPGQGSTFTLYLPQAVQTELPAPTDPDAGAAVGGLGARILVVEDNPEVATSVEASLHELGFVTEVVFSAADALARLDDTAADGFDAVFSDIVMSGMDGIELARQIRSRRPALPVVLSSGYSDVLARDDVHGFDLLPKPYSLDALSDALRAAIAGRARSAASTVSAADAELIGRLGLPGSAAEQMRQTELDSLLIVDTDAEQIYDELTRLAATSCDAPIALISMIDGDRQWFKSRVGLQARETPREDAFCAHAIKQPDQVMIVHDASRDPRFVDNPLVTGDPHIRFYAGAPLVTASGQALGTICVIDYQPREIAAEQIQLLRTLASQVVSRLEQRRDELSPVALPSTIG